VAYHFTGVRPALYGIEAIELPPRPDAQPLLAPFHPLPGRYVIGVDALQRGWPADPDLYNWFRQVTPTARLANSFFVYDVATIPLEWFGQCTTPEAPLSEEEIAAGFGRADLRRVYFDCTTAWLYPNGGVAPGAYGLHHALLTEEAHAFPSLLPSLPKATDPFIARRLSGMRLSLDMRRFQQFPAFVLYEQGTGPEQPPLTLVVALPVAGFPSDPLPGRVPPVALDGPLAFLGATAFAQGDVLDVETWWQVTGSPVIRPFSIMGHVLSGEGVALGVADGLGVSPLLLETGDVLVQRHSFPRVFGETELWLRTGVYWLDTQERWAVAGEAGADGLFVRLEVQ
jgi:hypothetical protein